MQKRPTNMQKRPKYMQKRPRYMQKRLYTYTRTFGSNSRLRFNVPSHTRKYDLKTCKREPHMWKRYLDICKRDLSNIHAPLAAIQDSDLMSHLTRANMTLKYVIETHLYAQYTHLWQQFKTQI